MRFLEATIVDIQSCETLNVVVFEVYGDRLSMMSLELGSEIEVGVRVKLGVKPASVAIAKDFSGELSYSNQLRCKISSVENGEILSSIDLLYYDIKLESIITLSSSKRLDLKEGDEVVALIKASELSIMGIL